MKGWEIIVTTSKKIGLSLIATGLGFFVLFCLIQHHYDQEQKRAEITLQQKKKQLKVKQAKVHANLLSKAQQNGSTVKSQNLRVNVLNTEVSQKADGFFKAFKTYNDLASWRKRKELCKPYVTNNVLNNKAYFNSGLDKTGKDAVAAQGSSVSFTDCQTHVGAINGDNMTAISKVTFSSQTGTHSAVTVTDYYKLNYSISQQKFTDVQRVGNLEAVAD